MLGASFYKSRKSEPGDAKHNQSLSKSQKKLNISDMDKSSERSESPKLPDIPDIRTSHGTGILRKSKPVQRASVQEPPTFNEPPVPYGLNRGRGAIKPNQNSLSQEPSRVSLKENVPQKEINPYDSQESSFYNKSRKRSTGDVLSDKKSAAR